MGKTVFISHAKEDSKSAETLFDFLTSCGLDPWLDKKKLLPGQKWEVEIMSALKKADFVILLLSKISVTKRGFVQKEFKLALEYCKTKLDSDIYVIPFKIDDCEIPEEVREFQWVELSNPDPYEQILKAIKQQIIKQENEKTQQENKEEVKCPEKLKPLQSIKTISLFLASSEELKNDRAEFEIFINRENKELINKGIFIKLVLWEDFIDKMSPTRLQDEYNRAAINSDIFISLYWTKVGKFTKEEFSQVYTRFIQKGKPFIYTYFKQVAINPNVDNSSRLVFIKKLQQLGHYPTYYENIYDLKYQFKMQLQKILPQVEFKD